MLTLASLLLACTPQPPAPPPTPPTSAETLATIDRVEEPTESLATALHELSRDLRFGDSGTSLEPWVGEQLDASVWPTEADAPTTPHSRVTVAPYVLAQASPGLSSAWTGSLSAFLATIDPIEDIRIKVAQSTWDGARLTGTLKLRFVRDADVAATWVKGMAEFTALRTEDGWTFERFALTALTRYDAETPLFTEVASSVGMVEGYAERPWGAIGGVGAAAADVDDNGFVDLYVVGQYGSHLYLNRGPDGFEKVSGPITSQTPTKMANTSALFVDIDDDGDEDLFLGFNGRPQRLYRNELAETGTLDWTNISAEAGVKVAAWAHSAVAGDIDNDGDVDLYVTSYEKDPGQLRTLTQGDNGSPNLLFLNDGKGHFTEAAAKWGVADARWSLAAQLADLDRDGDLDLVVANDWGGGNTLYRNEGDHFVDVGEESGLFEHMNGMGVSIGDPDNDGDLDVHVTNMSSTAGNRILSRLGPELKADPWYERAERMAKGNSLFENDGNGQFAAVAPDKGPLSAGWAWGGGFVDIDNDGWADVVAPNGYSSGHSMADT